MQHVNKPIALAVAACLAAGLAGCASSRSADVYNANDAMVEAQVRYATVDSVRPVKIQSDGEVGKLIGVILGGIAGSNMGQGKGAAVGAIAGATAGGVVGNAIGKDANSRDGVEIVLTLENGQSIAIVQEADVIVTPGQKVRIITRGRVSRVVPVS